MSQDLPPIRNSGATPSSDVPDTMAHADPHNRNIIERMLLLIPGFRGYLRREYRRESDHLLRTWMAERLQTSKRGLDHYLRALVDAGQIDALPQLERVRSRLDGTIAMIRGQMRGYSGFFDFVKVREAQLNEVYEVDLKLAEEAERLAASIEQLSVKDDTPSAVTTDLLARIDAFDDDLQLRSQLLQGTAAD